MKPNLDAAWRVGGVVALLDDIIFLERLFPSQARLLAKVVGRSWSDWADIIDFRIIQYLWDGLGKGGSVVVLRWIYWALSFDDLFGGTHVLFGNGSLLEIDVVQRLASEDAVAGVSEAD